jgi:hypothetical protein
VPTPPPAPVDRWTSAQIDQAEHNAALADHLEELNGLLLAHKEREEIQQALERLHASMKLDVSQ